MEKKNIFNGFSPLPRACYPANTKQLYNIYTTSAQRLRRLRRWSNMVEMLYKCFVFVGIASRELPIEQLCA